MKIYKESELFLLEAKGVRYALNAFLLYNTIKKMVTPWEKTEAFRLGLIDENGKKLKSAESEEEKSAYSLTHRFVFNLKRLLEKLPFGKSRLGSFAAALFLLKEETRMSQDLDILEQNFLEFVDELDMDQLAELHKEIEEEAPANAVGHGNIAGAEPDTDSPPVRRKKKKKTFDELKQSLTK